MSLRRLRAALLLALPAAAHAQAQAPTVLDTTIVTANRSARTVDATLAAVSVIDRAQIERSQAGSAAALLQGLPGISIANNGGPGKNTSVFLRGTESDHVLVLVDGVKIGSATSGSAALQDIPAELIDRIEVVRGPRSSLYGSEAIGGVIQIFTRRERGAPKPRVAVGVGSRGSHDSHAGLSLGSEDAWFNLDAGTAYTSGINSCTGKPSPRGAGCFTIEPDRDGYRRRDASLSGGWRMAPGTELDAHWLETRSVNDFDGSFVNQAESRQQVLGARLRTAPTEYWTLSVAIGRSRDESDNFRDNVFATRFDTRRDSASWQNDLALGDAHLLTVGVDWLKDTVDSTNNYAEDSRDNTGVFAQFQSRLGGHDLEFSLRRDDNQQFGGRNTGGVAWGYLLPGAVRMTAAYGTAFKAPTFNELYFPGFGNPDLVPERSRSVELGLSGHLGLDWNLSLFQTRVSDLIAFDAAVAAPGNVDTARIRGIEAGAAWATAAWQASASASLIDPRHLGSGPNHGNLLPRRAKQTLRVDLDRKLGDARLGLTWLAAGKRYDDLANTRELGGYGTLDLRAERDLGAGWRIVATLSNLFDKDYHTAAFFNQPGRSLFVTLRYH